MAEVQHFCDGKSFGCRCREYQTASNAGLPDIPPTTPEGRIIVDLRQYVEDVTALIHLFATNKSADPLVSDEEAQAHALLVSDWLAAFINRGATR